jgi:hypothetical protein
MSLTYTLPQLKEALQEATEYTTRRRLALLEQQHGFPRRLPGFTARWSRPAVDDWFRHWGQPHATPAAGSSPVIDIQHALEATYVRTPHAS